MIAVDAAVPGVQALPAKVRRWKVSHRLRFWNIEAQAYSFTGAFVEIPREQVESIGPMHDSLDSTDINEFKSSNVTIELRNRDNEWSQDNPDGRFKPDATAKLGYEQQLMEFRVEVFYELADGTESSAITIFVGHATQFQFYPQKATAQVTLESRHVLLRRGDAEKVSNAFADKLLVATADPLVFLTTELGVDRVTGVRISGANQRPGIEVAISDLSTHNLPAKFTFTSPPAATPRADYRQWKRDQKIEQLVKDLGVQAGIPLTEQDVEPVAYSTRVVNTKLFTTQADWDGGLTVQNLDTTTFIGSIQRQWFRLDNFDDGDFTGNPAWTTFTGFGGSIVIGTLDGSSAMQMVSPVSLAGVDAHLSFSKTAGTWAFKMQWDGADGALQRVRVFIIATFNAPTIGQSTQVTGYCLEYRDGSVFFKKFTNDSGQVLGNVGTVLRNLGAIPGVSTSWRISRDSAGEFKIYKNGTLETSVTDTDHNSSQAFALQVNNNFGARFDDVYWSPGLDTGTSTLSDATAIWESQAIDGTDSLFSWTKADILSIIPANTSLTVETATADAVGGPYDAYVAISADGFIQSVNRRFLKLRITFNTPAFPNFDTARITDAIVTFLSTTTSIRMANFLNISCFDGIRTLGEIANYEWGLSRTGRLFFRPRQFKTVADYTVTMGITRGFLAQFSSISDGVDRVFNQVRAAYGAHDKLTDSNTRGDSRPHSIDRFGVKRLTIGGGSQILVDPDADIATGLATEYLTQFQLPRRRYDVKIPMIPQLELADTVCLRVADAVPDPPWHIGDTARALSATGPHRLFGARQQSAYNVLGRVLSVAHDVLADSTRLILEEII